MKKSVIVSFLAFIFFYGTGFSQDAQNGIFYNASFEVTYPETEIPMQWYSGSEFGLFFGADSNQYTQGNKSLLVRSTQPEQRWGAMSFLRMMDYDLAESIQTISIAMDIKSDSVSEGYFSPFTWKQTKSGEIIVKNLVADSLKGDMDWKRYSVTDTIGQEIDQNKIFAGIQLNGKGQVWIDNVQLFINGESVSDAGFNPEIPTDQDITFIKKHSTPFQHIDPYASLEDLDFLSEKIKDAEIVGLGEATHGTSEIFTMKHRLFKYLVLHHDFKVFALEGNAGASYRINEYLRTGKGDPVELVKALVFWTWGTEEVLELVKWMRQYNKDVSQERQLSFVGVDIQGAPQEISIMDSLSRPFPEFHKELMLLYRPLQKLGSLLEKGEYYEGFRDSLKTFQPMAEKGLSLVEDRQIEFTQRTDSLTYRWLHYMARSVRNYTVYFNHQFNRRIQDPHYLSRDSLMVNNITYFREKVNPAKMAFWAHNLHVAKTIHKDLGSMVGWHLKEEYGSQYRNIGFSFEKGYYRAMDGRKGKLTEHNFAYPPYPGCFEFLLSKLDSDLLFLDLAASASEAPEFYTTQTFRLRDLGAYAIDNQFFEHPLHLYYDYLIYMKETSAAKALE